LRNHAASFFAMYFIIKFPFDVGSGYRLGPFLWPTSSRLAPHYRV
jgi:hypothetical protein